MSGNSWGFRPCPLRSQKSVQTNTCRGKCLRPTGLMYHFFMLCDKDTDFGHIARLSIYCQTGRFLCKPRVKRLQIIKRTCTCFSEALGYSRTGKAIVEGFITGREFSVETYTQNNKTTVVTITEKLCIGEAEGFFC